MIKTIIVTGSVCSGKTTFAKKLAKKIHFTYLDVNKLIKKNKKVIASYDSLRKTKEIRTSALNRILLSIIKKEKRIIVDSHLSHYLPSKVVDLCIVCTCSLKTLKKRLEKRNYSKLKVKENLEAEIFEVCLIDALEAGHNTIVINAEKNTTKQMRKITSRIFSSSV